MAEQPIAANEYDTGSPITESLMTRIIENQQDLYVQVAAASEPTNLLTGSGTYVVPADVTKIKITLVSGGGGGGRGSHEGTIDTVSTEGGGGAGGAGGNIKEYITTVTPAASLSYSCGAGGSGAASSTTGFGADGSDGGDTTFDSTTCSGARTKGGGGGLVSHKNRMDQYALNAPAGTGNNKAPHITGTAGAGGRSTGSQNGGDGGWYYPINGATGQSWYDGQIGECSGGVFIADMPTAGVRKSSSGGGGGAGGNFSYPQALDIFGAITNYKGGDGSDGEWNVVTGDGGDGGTASGGGGSGGSGSTSIACGAGGDGGDGFILIWELG